MTDIGADAVALAAELVGIDSVNPGLVPGANGERRIVEHLSGRLERSGFTVTIVPPGSPADRPRLIAASPPTGIARSSSMAISTRSASRG